MTRTEERHSGVHKPAEVSAYPDMISDTTTVFGMAKIVPGVIDHVTDEVNMSVFFGDKQVTNAQQVTLDDLATEPRISLAGHARTDVFTVIMVDPDMPSPHNPKYKDTLCWMVNNVKGSDFEHGDFTVEYMAPEPGQGKHRYVILLFKQPGSAFRKFEPPSVRVNFQTKQWAKEHGLGDPVAALFVTAQHD